MIAFASGVGAGMMYKKHEKDIMRMFKKTSKKTIEVK